MSSIWRDSAGLNARSSPIRRSSPTSPFAVTRLLIPCSNASSSSTPRRRSIPSSAEAVERALQHVEPDEVEQEVRRQVAARRDHVLGELGHAQRAADLAMHFGVGVAVDAHPVGRAVVRR